MSSSFRFGCGQTALWSTKQNAISGESKHATWPKQNAEFWRTKILRNRARDREVNRLLKNAGWRVLRIWEHALTRKHEARTVARLRRVLAGG